MFTLKITATFASTREKMAGSNKVLNKRIKVTLQKLALNPAHPSLQSHKVNTRNCGIRWSSWVQETYELFGITILNKDW